MDRVLLVDDEINVLRALQRALHLHLGTSEIKVEIYERPADALLRAEEVPFAVVMSDYRMPHMDGVAFLKRFKAIQPGALRLILSAQADQGALIEAINEAQIHRFLAKPWNDEELVASIRAALAAYHAKLEEQHLVDQARLDGQHMSRQEYELKRLEETEPGITKVKWGPDGEVLIDGEG
ncbi:MAG: response regulator [Burkholderiales bacterium]|nr:MAG: response regulator [Burkholderiales bacterium]